MAQSVASYVLRFTLPKFPNTKKRETSKTGSVKLQGELWKAFRSFYQSSFMPKVPKKCNWAMS